MEEQNNTFGDKLRAWGRFFISGYFIKNILIYIATIAVFLILVVQGLKWYTRHNQQISVPAVENMSIDEAKQLIRQRGLVPEVIDCTYTGSVDPGKIIPGGQQPIAGYAVKKGRTVYLTYKAFSKRPVKLPNILESFETAKSELSRCGLILGKVKEEEDETVLSGSRVLEVRFGGKKISEGHELHEGDVIDLTIAIPKKDNSDASPSGTPDATTIDEEF